MLPAPIHPGGNRDQIFLSYCPHGSLPYLRQIVHEPPPAHAQGQSPQRSDERAVKRHSVRPGGHQRRGQITYSCYTRNRRLGWSIPTSASTLPKKSLYFAPRKEGLPYIYGVDQYLDPANDKPIVLPLPEPTSLHGTMGIGKTWLIELSVSQLIQQKKPEGHYRPQVRLQTVRRRVPSLREHQLRESVRVFLLRRPSGQRQFQPFCELRHAR